MSTHSDQMGNATIFYERKDRWAGGLCFLLSLLVYTYTLAPSVTLEDSGELIVAADYLGVPHPPGYPVWTLLAWLFQKVFFFVTYQGFANPAWGVAFMSAFFGAAASGLVAMLISRSSRDLLAFRPLPVVPHGQWLPFAAGLSGGLLLAFSPVLWSQSVIAEVYSLNAFFFAALLVLVYRWLMGPASDGILYGTAFLFACGLCNHQTLLFAAPGLALAVFLRDKALFRDLVIYGVGGAGLGVVALRYIPNELAALFVWSLALLLLPPVLYRLSRRKLLSEWRRVCWLCAMLLAGLSFYLYLPLASLGNPPMNWGYPQTWDTFKAVVARSQYEAVRLAGIFADPWHFRDQLREFIYGAGSAFSIPGQFSWPLALLGLAPLALVWKAPRAFRRWVAVVAVMWVFVSIIFMILQNPDLSLQDSFIKRVQYIPTHMLYALLIGYGLAWLPGVLVRQSRWPAATAWACLALLLLVPAVPLGRNAWNEKLLFAVGGAEQRGHDYGWQFGDFQLRGIAAIRASLAPGEPLPPNTDYPPAMAPNAMFFGGTDPGRFVPTYMIYSARVRPDIHLITQNALANACYLDELHGIFKDTVWLPSQQDSNTAFRLFYESAMQGRIPYADQIRMQDGHMQVCGADGVMWINGVLAQMIFEKNKHQHEFYVEESYVMPWMYPYLTPHGLIMKLNPEPVESLDPQLVKKDHAFWRWYCGRLLAQPAFKRDLMAQRSFSKLRTAIAGLYAVRGMLGDAETAFQDAIRLYPQNLEAHQRLIQQVLVPQQRFAEARANLEGLMARDPTNRALKMVLGSVLELAADNTRRQQLESALTRGASIADALELCRLYFRFNMRPQFTALACQLARQSNLPIEVGLSLAGIFCEASQLDAAQALLAAQSRKHPGHVKTLIELAAVCLQTDRRDEFSSALQQALAMGGAYARSLIQNDQRFAGVRLAAAP